LKTGVTSDKLAAGCTVSLNKVFALQAVTNSDLLTTLVALRQDGNPLPPGNTAAQTPGQGQEINCRVS